MKEIIEKYGQRTKQVLISVALTGLVGCYTHTQSLSSTMSPESRKSTAQGNLVQLLSDRGYIFKPYAEYVDENRIKTRCYQGNEGNEFIFNCNLLESINYDCGPLRGEVALKLKSGEKCSLSAENLWVATGDGCTWARQVEENLKAYCLTP